MGASRLGLSLSIGIECSPIYYYQTQSKQRKASQSSLASLMRTYAIRDKQGNLLSFEVSSLLGRRLARRVAAAIPDAQVVKSDLRNDTFCEFQVANEMFAIEEPFGDNSRFWIGPIGDQRSSTIEIIHSHFEQSRLGSIGYVLGMLFCMVLIATPLVPHGCRLIAQDKCLDSGGAWVQSACQKNPNTTHSPTTPPNI
jgi:hypothetical protein